MQDQLDAVTEASSTLRRQLDAMKAKLAEAKRNLSTLTARKRAADVRKKSILSADEKRNLQLDDDAFKKFDRMREKVEMAEAEAEALAELQAGGTTSDLEMEPTLSQSVDIEEQLAELKKQANQ